MAEVPALTPLARLVVALGVVLLAVGAIWHGVAFEEFKRLWRDLFERSGGPMSFRFLLQPTMAAIAAGYDGIADARTNRVPYLSALLHDPSSRGARLSEGLVATARIMLLGIGMDVIYQWKASATFYPAEAFLIALALAFVPYLLLRGPIARIARWWMDRHQPPAHGSMRR